MGSDVFLYMITEVSLFVYSISFRKDTFRLCLLKQTILIMSIIFTQQHVALSIHCNIYQQQYISNTKYNKLS